MKMEVIAIQNQFQAQYGALGSSKVRDWTTTLTAPLTSQSPSSSAHNSIAASTIMNAKAAAAVATHRHPYLQSSSSSGASKNKHSINNKSKSSGGGGNPTKQPRYHAAPVTITVAAPAAAPLGDNHRYDDSLFCCDDAALDTGTVQELATRLLAELRAAKSRHLTCTEVSLPCDLIPRIAAEVIRVSGKEPCGLRGCTIHIEFEDEPNNSRRIASLKAAADAAPVPTFEVYLTLRQDRRGWTALLPQFMKSLARTITISPEFTITKNKLYAAQQLSRSSSISYARPQRPSAALATSSS